MRVVALDVGSSSVRAVAFDEQARAEPGDAQLSYDDLDADRLVDACRAVLAQVGEADAVAISAFWHSLVAVDAHERPLAPVLTWRSTAVALPPLDPERYHLRTGCFLHPAYWPAKVLQLRAEGIEPARFLSFADYLLLKLTGELRTSVSTASGTGLFDPNRLNWDGESCEALGVNVDCLAPIADDRAAGVFPALGDGACSNLGAGCVTRKRCALMIGTSAAARVVYAADRAEPRDGLFLYRVDGERFCEGGALSDGGNLYAWLERTLCDLDPAGIAARPAAVHGLTFAPFLGGERSLGWDPSRRGAVSGLSFETTPVDIAQAALEGVAYRFADVLDAIGGIDEIVVTGGALLANPDWTQILADAIGRPLGVSEVAEGSARGAAVAALERLGAAPPAAGIERIARPRPDWHAAHVQARTEQRALIAALPPPLG